MNEGFACRIRSLMDLTLDLYPYHCSTLDLSSNNFTIASLDAKPCMSVWLRYRTSEK